MPLSDRNRFFLRNFGRGLIWLGIIVIVFLILFNLISEVHYEQYLQPVYDKPLWVFLIYTASEIIFGIISPEIFMIWALKSHSLVFYLFTIIVLALISYGAGVLGYFIGRYFNNTRLYGYFHRRFLAKYVDPLKRFGGFLIIVAALTPVPFSAVAMLMGAVDYPLRNYILYSLTRFIRFIIYPLIIWQTGFLT